LARYRGSVKKLARNSGGSLDGFPKTTTLNRSYPSGQHGQMRKKLSEYALQLKEKQKVRRTYGVQEKQFRKYYEWAVRKEGVTGTLLLQRLESRLDNIVFRSGLAASRPQARQIISHGHILVNGQRVNVASYRVKPGDEVSVAEKSKTFLNTLQEGRAPIIPQWIEVDAKGLKAKVAAVPERQEMDQSFNEQLIIEFYSR